jgi:hypothetical protein
VRFEDVALSGREVLLRGDGSARRLRAAASLCGGHPGLGCQHRHHHDPLEVMCTIQYVRVLSVSAQEGDGRHAGMMLAALHSAHPVHALQVPNGSLPARPLPNSV